MTATASPLQTVSRRDNRPDWDAIAKLIATWQPDALVVGEPLNMDGTEQPMTKAARRFANQLNGRFHLPVHLADERLSTRAARDQIWETDAPNRSRRPRKGGEDHPVAAKVILETWFASQAELKASGERTGP